MDFVEVSYNWSEFFLRFFPDEEIKWGNVEENTNSLNRATQLIVPFAEENHAFFDLSFLLHGRVTFETTQNDWNILRPFIEQGGLSSV